MDEDKFMCSISWERAYDPVKVSGFPFLYDRSFLETLLEKHPNNTPLPQTRQPFTQQDIIPDVSTRHAIRRGLASHHQAADKDWDVIPDYPLILTTISMCDIIHEILTCFSSAENLRDVRPEMWVMAWKRLNYLRLNIQLESSNRHTFLTMNNSIAYLGRIIGISLPSGFHTLGETQDECRRFHREVLRTIRVVLGDNKLMYEVVVSQLIAPGEWPHYSDGGDGPNKVRRFLLGLYQLGDQGFQVLILRLLRQSIILETFKAHHIRSIMDPIGKAKSSDISCAHLAIAAEIFRKFYEKSRKDDNKCPLPDLGRSSLQALVQTLNFLLIKRSDNGRGEEHIRSEDGVGHSLYVLKELCKDGNAMVIEWLDRTDALSIIHEMIEMTVKGSPSSSLRNLELALKSVRRLYMHGGNERALATGRRQFHVFRELFVLLSRGNENDRQKKIKVLLNEIMALLIALG